MIGLRDRIAVRRGGTESGPYPAALHPLKTEEQTFAQQTVTTRYRLTVTAALDLTATDAIVWRGREYQVDGDVEPWTVNGRLHHQEATVKRVTG